MAVQTVVVVAYQLPLGDCNVFRQAPAGDADGTVDTVLQQPGAVLGYEHGVYTDLDPKNMTGNATLPIHIIPLADTGRLVEYQAGSGDANIRNMKYVHWDGSGIAGETYGFVLYDRMHWYDNLVTEETNNIEINNVDVDISAVVNEIGIKFTPRSAHVIDDVEIHHCRVRSVASTALYIGEPLWDSHPGTFEMSNVEIHDNIVYGSESGIELKGAPSGTNSIHDNSVTDTDPSASGAQEGAIFLAQGTLANVYNNWVQDSGGNGIATTSDRTGQDIYNNLVVNVGYTDPTYQSAVRVHGNAGAASIDIYNNTLVTGTDYGIEVDAGASDVEAWNNVILDFDTDDIDQGGSPAGQFHDNDTQNDGYTIANYDFTDAGSDDYSILVTSPGKNSGTNAPTSPATDIDGNARDPVTPSKGAYE